MIAKPAVLVVLLAGLSAPADADDASYCRTLVAEYQRYYVKLHGHSPRPGPVDGNVAAERCLAGDPAGIPVLEQKLRDARAPLPPR